MGVFAPTHWIHSEDLSGNYGGLTAGAQSTSAAMRMPWSAVRTIIEAAVSVADEECVVLLGRIARTAPAFADAALEALESIDHPRAAAIAAAARAHCQKENAA